MRLNESWLILAVVLFAGCLWWLAWRNIKQAIDDRQVLPPTPPPDQPDPADPGVLDPEDAYARLRYTEIIDWERHLQDRNFDNWN